MSYAIIAIGGKQYRVREGERLRVDRLPYEEGKTFHPDLLLLGGDGDARLAPELAGEKVTARVAAHVLGEKVVIGKHRRRTGYRRRKGHRSRLSEIEIESIGTAKREDSLARAETKKRTAKKAEKKEER